jgi:hypothetical protein
MGLDIRVGMLSALEEEDPEAAQFHRALLGDLNAVLAEAGQAPHEEPVSLAPDECFEAQMWGYGGLHHVRRLAAHLDLSGHLPPVCTYESATDDPLLAQYYAQCDRHFVPARRGLFSRFGTKPQPPRFLHLVCHSDCEGFYLPRALPAVIFDLASEPRAGIGGMVGSAVSLAEEVRVLCAALAIPADLDPEDESVWENAEDPPVEGAAYARYGVETFVLTRLRRACDLSIRTGSALVFT